MGNDKFEIDRIQNAIEHKLVSIDEHRTELMMLLRRLDRATDGHIESNIFDMSESATQAIRDAIRRVWDINKLVDQERRLEEIKITCDAIRDALERGVTPEFDPDLYPTLYDTLYGAEGGGFSPYGLDEEEGRKAAIESLELDLEYRRRSLPR